MPYTGPSRTPFSTAVDQLTTLEQELLLLEYLILDLLARCRSRKRDPKKEQVQPGVTTLTGEIIWIPWAAGGPWYLMFGNLGLPSSAKLASLEPSGDLD